jgi:DNA topoisomerase VI subunit A
MDHTLKTGVARSNRALSANSPIVLQQYNPRHNLNEGKSTTHASEDASVCANHTMTKELATKIDTAFFDADNFRKRAGVDDKDLFALAMLKELLDNASDEVEAAGVPEPAVTMNINARSFTVSDNGRGIPTDLLEKLLTYVDYRTTKSTKGLNRGQQGNALLTLFASGYVASGKPTHLTIEAQGVRHNISVGFNHLTEEPVVEHDITALDEATVGTKITLEWPDAKDALKDADYLLNAYRTFNPHISYNGVTSESEKFKKVGFGKGSPHWYSVTDLFKDINRQVRADEDMRLRDYLAGFHGISADNAAKVERQFTPLLLELLNGNETKAKARVAKLLTAMQKVAKTVKESELGSVALTEAALQHAAGKDAVLGRPKFVTERGVYETQDGQTFPYAIEVGTASTDDTGRVVFGINYSPAMTHLYAWVNAYRNTPEGSSLRDKLPSAGCSKSNVLAIHIITPFSFSDYGKKDVALPEAMKTSLAAALTKVFKKSYKTKYAMSKKDAAFSVMEMAYRKVAGPNNLSAGARQIFYVARPLIMLKAEREKVTQNEFNKWLRQFVREREELTKDWNFYFEERGYFEEPHTFKEFGLGTVAVDKYINGWEDAETGAMQIILPGRFPTSKPENRIGGILFIEKRGFRNVIAESKLAERFDLGMMSTVGHSNLASRRLIDGLAGRGIPLYVLHDFDISGFDILAGLTKDTDDYEYQNEVKITDLFTYQDVVEMGLESEPVKGEGNPRERLLETLPKEVVDFLVPSTSKAWEGKRVELNAMTNPQLVDLLERKLQAEVDAGRLVKVVPDEETLMAAATYFEQVRRIEEYVDVVKKETTTYEPPTNLYGSTCDTLKKFPERSWDCVVRILVLGLQEETTVTEVKQETRPPKVSLSEIRKLVAESTMLDSGELRNKLRDLFAICNHFIEGTVSIEKDYDDYVSFKIGETLGTAMDEAAPILRAYDGKFLRLISDREIYRSADGKLFLTDELRMLKPGLVRAGHID